MLTLFYVMHVGHIVPGIATPPCNSQNDVYNNTEEPTMVKGRGSTQEPVVTKKNFTSMIAMYSDFDLNSSLLGIYLVYTIHIHMWCIYV